MESRIIEALEKGQIVLVTGLRGTGKTTLLRSVERRLARSRGKGSVALLDLEDPRFAPRPHKETLEMFSGESRYALLDEVGRVDGWLDWARRRIKRTGHGVVATCSGPRQDVKADDVLELTLHPERITDMSVDLENYLQEGGLPGTGGRNRLVDLFYRILFMDVVRKSEVRDIDKLTAISVYLLASTSRPVSATRLKGLLSRSVDQARGFLAHLERAGLVYLVPRLEDENRDRTSSARRCFSADCGLSVALANRELERRDLAETAVFHELLRLGLTVRAWRARGRLGLAVAGKSGPGALIDVTYRDRARPGTKALASAMKAHSCRQGLLLGDDQTPETIEVAPGSILKQSLRQWLESPGIPGMTAPKPAPGKKAAPSRKKDSARQKQPAGLPRHLL